MLEKKQTNFDSCLKCDFQILDISNLENMVVLFANLVKNNSKL